MATSMLGQEKKRNPACGRGELCLPQWEELTTTDFTELTVTAKPSLCLSCAPAAEMSSAFVHAWLPSSVTGP